MSDEEKKEEIRIEDRRHFDSEGNLITAGQSETTEKTQDQPESVPTGGGGKVNFTSVLFSFVHTALVQLGDLEDPVRKSVHEDLEGAHQMIDILECLQAKTRGNLDPDEEQYLSGALFDLRMRYMQKAKIIR